MPEKNSNNWPIPDPPGEVVADLAYLVDRLDEQIPAKILDHNLLIATWNIRSFGRVTRKWQSGPNDSPRRDYHAVHYIAEIISRFDVVAIQELRGNLDALRLTLSILGRNWGLILTDVTKGDPGNDERMGFLFDTRRVNLSGLACEIVIDEAYLKDRSRNLLEKQFARTPYAVGFQSLQKRFTLVSLHVQWGKADTEEERRKKRIPELQAIADWMHEWAEDENAWDSNLIVLGDFNIVGKDRDLLKAFSSTGLAIPDDLMELPRTLSGIGKLGEERLYDQIAWFKDGKGLTGLDRHYQRGGNFDFSEFAMKYLNLRPKKLSWRISDHLPLWVEFLMED
jgi:endonuclease/exonuclease/phosphatase family metal-dependent hydrolase